MVNTIFTNAGVTQMANWLAGISATAPSHIAYGDDSTNPNVSDTALGNELGRKEIETTTNTASRASFSMIVLSSEQNGQTLKEVGALNAATDGDLFTHSTFAPIAKTSSIEVEFEITLQVVN